MVLRYRSYHYVRNAVTLGTSLTALFILVRCSVPERDYSQLGIGENAGSGGLSGSAGEGAGGASAGQSGVAGQGGQDGLGDAGGLGGQGGAPLEPIPCTTDSNDAGISDAGISDAGISDAGIEDASTGDPNPYGADCACVDGFIRAVDADGDGVGTRACTFAPGLDCDDGDDSVTHNSCGGCAALPNAVGADCLDCGAYACDGPDSVVCATKPDAVLVDPDCRCLNALIVARDTDEDGQGTRLCEENPGSDCNDGDDAFISNQCGGCESLPGTVGQACNECGVYACSGTALACVPSTGAAGRRCLNTTTRQTCVGTGFWSGDTVCGNVCYQGNCETCTPTPATYRCIPLGGGSFQLERCVTDASLGSSSYGIGWTSWDSCSPTQTCNATIGQCTGYLLLPRDRTFDVAPLQRGGLPWHEVLNTADDSDYG